MAFKKTKNAPITEEPAVETVEEPVVETVEEPAPEVEETVTKVVDTECLNVRKRAGGEVVGRLHRNDTVIVDSTKGEWSKISSPIKGYCMSQYLK